MNKSPVAIALLLSLGSGAHAAAPTEQWSGSGPFASGLGNQAIDSLAISADGMRLLAGSGSGTVFSYTYASNAATPPATSDSGSPTTSPSNPPTNVIAYPGTTTTLGGGTAVIAMPGSSLLIPAGGSTIGTSIALPTPTAGGSAAAVSVTIGGQQLQLIPSVAGTTLSVRSVAVNGVPTQVLALTSGSFTVIASQSGAPLLALGSGGNSIVLTAGAGGASVTGTVDSSSGQTVLAVASGVVTLPANAYASAKSKAASSTSAGSAPPADGKLYAGELAAIGGDGKIVSVRLGTPAGSGGGDALNLRLADNLGFAGKVPQLAATSARLGQSLQTAFAEALGATLAGTQSNGVLALDIGGSRIYVLPLGDVMVDRTRGDGVRLEADGTLSVGVADVVLRLAPSVADPGQLARDLAAALPGAALQVGGDGTLRLALNGQYYALRPGWLSQDATATGFASAAGQLTYGQTGRNFVLYPGVADYASLAAVVEQGMPGVSLSINGDGTVTLSGSGQQWTLLPEMALQSAPAGAAAWWPAGDGTLLLRNADGTMQGFSVR